VDVGKGTDNHLYELLDAVDGAGEHTGRYKIEFIQRA
jgi:hypothetical protein